MKCSKCGCDNSKVIDTRKFADTVCRIRKCEKCNHPYRTWEVKDEQIAVIDHKITCIDAT